MGPNRGPTAFSVRGAATSPCWSDRRSRRTSLALGPILDLPSMVERVPGDATSRVAWRPLAAGEGRAVERPAEDVEDLVADRTDRVRLGVAIGANWRRSAQ